MLVSLIAVSGSADAQVIRALASLNDAVDLEVGGSAPPTYDCPGSDLLVGWNVYESHDSNPGVWDYRWTIPFDGPFPWRRRTVITGWRGPIYTFELRPVCGTFPSVYEEPSIAATSAATGIYDGTYYFDTVIESGGFRDPDVRSVTVMSEPECFTGGTVSGPCWPTLTFSESTIAPQGNTVAYYGHIVIQNATFKGNVDVYGSSLTITESAIEGYLQSRSYQAFGGPLTDSEVTIDHSMLERQGPNFYFDESSVRIFDSTFLGQGVPVIGRALRASVIEIKGNEFRDRRATDPGVRTDLLEVDCAAGGCGCELQRNTFESWGDDVVLKIGSSSSCDVAGNTLQNTRFAAQEGQFDVAGNDFFWTIPQIGAVVVASVGPRGSIRDNIIRGTDVTGLVVYGNAADFTVAGNSFCVPFPGGTGLQSQASGTLDAAANYWGDATGPFPGSGAYISGTVDHQPFLASGSCGSVFIDKVELVQGLATTNLVAGKPVVLRVFLGNDGSAGISGVSVTGSMAGETFAASGLHVPVSYSWPERHKGEDSVNIVNLPVPAAGVGEVKVQLHYVDPDLGLPVTQERSLSYTASAQKILKIGAVGVGVSQSTLKTTFKKQLPLLRAMYPTHRVMIYRMSALPSLTDTSGALGKMWAANKYGTVDVMVGVVNFILDLWDFDAGWGSNVLIWEHLSPCGDHGTLGGLGESTFVLSHAVAHGLTGAADEHRPDNPGWNVTDLPYGILVESGWDVFRGKSGLIHSNYPDNPDDGWCPEYVPGETDHICNFFNFMATECLPPKWISPGMRSSLFNRLAVPTGGSGSVSSAAPVAALAVPVTLWEDETGKIEGLYDIVDTPSISDPSGAWAVATRDGSGAVLDQVSFNVAFRDTDPDLGIRFGGKGVTLPAGPAVAEVVLMNGMTVIDSIARSGAPPVVTLLSPNGGENLSSTFSVQWSASDPDSDPLTFMLMAQCEGSGGWTPSGLEVTGTSLSLDTADLPGGNTCDLRIIASDGRWSSSDDSDASFRIAPHPPEVEILSPVEGASFETGIEVAMAGMAIDQDGDDLAVQDYVWSSDLAGLLGTGDRLSVHDLPVGSHDLTLTVTDSGSLQGSATVSIVVTSALDADNDSLPDWWEQRWGTQLGVKDDTADPDVDGLTNAEELAHGTDPMTRDSDSDGWLDGQEVAHGTDPLDPNDNPSVLLVDDFESGDTSMWSETIP